MSNTPLQVMRELSDLHRTATTTMLNERTPAVRCAYEKMANELHVSILGIASGNDPKLEVDYLRESWLSQAELADGLAPKLFERWAGTLESRCWYDVAT